MISMNPSGFSSIEVCPGCNTPLFIKIHVNRSIISWSVRSFMIIHVIKSINSSIENLEVSYVNSLT